MLTTEIKKDRVAISIALLTRYNLDAKGLRFGLVTCDETSIYFYDPETKQEIMKWKYARSPKTRKFEASRFTKKVTATVFLGSKGEISINYLPTGRSILGDYYADFLRRLREAITGKRRGKPRHSVLHPPDNTPVHTSKVAMAVVKRIRTFATPCLFTRRSK